MGLVDGVIETTPGWLQGIEVVEVGYDPRVVSLDALIAHADKHRCAVKVFTRSDAQQKIATRALGSRAVRTDERIRVDDNKYYLSRTPYKHVPMTAAQATRLNERVGAKKNLGDLLSPRQRAWLDDIRTHPDAGWATAIGRDIDEAWASAASVRTVLRK